VYSFLKKKVCFKRRSQMKNLIKAAAVVLTLGAASFSFAGNRPAVPNPPGVVFTANPDGQLQASDLWKKGAAVKHLNWVMNTGVWYTYCPVMTNVCLNSKHETEVTLSNGKKIMLSSAGLKNVVEANLQKYEAYMYGGPAAAGDTRMAMAKVADDK
jgi:hypothetical protein